MTISWTAPISDGGWPILNYLIWVDDGNGVWPANPITVPIASFDSLDLLTYEILGLTDGNTYGVKVQASNSIGISVQSNTQYFACATIPGAIQTAPTLEAATNSSITIAWSVPTNNGGVPVSGYKVYINSLDQGDWFLIYDGTGQPTVLTTEIDNLTRGELYRFYVTAVNYVGEGAKSP